MRTYYTTVLVAITIVAVLCGVGLFAVDTGSTAPEPVSFNETVSMGVDFDDDLEDADAVDLPKTQVFYSQYEFVVGYHGVERFVHAREQAGHQQRFGYPLAVYVTDFSDTDVELTEEGYPTANEPTGWTDAESAAFVVDSDARNPAGETVVPFADRDDAEAFTAEYGGTVLTWDELVEREFSFDDAAAVKDRVDDRLRDGDALVDDRRTMLDRPEETVVDDGETVQEAIDDAPSNTTVVVPEGTYEETVEIDRPITLSGEGAVTLDGGGDGTVVEIGADEAAVRNVDITGVGNTTRPEEQETVSDTDSGDTVLEMAYAGGDAGVRIDGAERALVENVTIETPANGVMLRDSPESVVRNVSVDGGDDWGDAYMGVMSMRSGDGVIEDSTFRDGRDGIYTHRSDGLVFRNNTLERNRIGVHLMYTAQTVIADNEVLNAEATGVHVMTNPHGNAVVGNEIRNSPDGLRTEGWNSYVADNVVVDNGLGMTTEAGNSIYEGNVVAGNDVGIQASHILPTNRVIGNDFVDNDRHATARAGTLRIWTRNDAGNYWHGAIGDADGDVLERPYSPTEDVDGSLHRTDGASSLARSPLHGALTDLAGTVSGMRDASIVDTAPRCEPANPEQFDAIEWNPPERDCGPIAPA
ncbi:NosD domain-containing protein [Natronolimnohabitans sp. A-GB9]|uniref:right-handed parallel beta-helix repeat-containing protein n=1 Tax=Natronolimnohabitans sp. A-GB9 TaxID=3069757 RepID=UPI0027B75726|nr:right-handed parallel beta-helix repeat-containing protein [Natronolimnohabitans sp. A-GB9]MDQ2050066.1 NosD domain-containing protein [Natronolimnohabitans sp. A-GB9]